MTTSFKQKIFRVLLVPTANDKGSAVLRTLSEYCRYYHNSRQTIAADDSAANYERYKT
jgi:hypothetical protein